MPYNHLYYRSLLLLQNVYRHEDTPNCESEVEITVMLNSCHLKSNVYFLYLFALRYFIPPGS